MAIPQFDLISAITPIFVFIFILAIFYALLNKLKLFGENKGVNSLIAFSVSILLISIQETRELINFMTPWFIVFVVLVVFIMMIFMFLGVEEESFKKLATENTGIILLVIFIVIAIFLTSLSKVYGPSLFAAKEAGFWYLLKSTIFNPKVLGVVLILAIAAETIHLIESK